MINNSKLVEPLQVERPATAAGDLLRRIIRRVQSAGVPFCILHGHERLPDQIDSDVDCLVLPESIPGPLADLLFGPGEELEGEVVQWIDDGAHYVVLADSSCEHGLPALVPLHLSTEFELLGRVLFSAEEILERKRPCDGFFIPAADHEFAGILANRVIKRSLKSSHERRLSTLYAEDPEGCRHQLKRLFGDHLANEVDRSASSGDWGAVHDRLNVLRKSLLVRASIRHPFATAHRRLADWGRRLKRWLRPKDGLHVVFLGPDGVGKSTVIEGVTGHLERAFFRSEYLTFAPQLYPRSKPRPPGVGPHGLPPRSRAASLVKAAWWLLCYTVGYLVSVRPTLARGGLVINHRYLLDALVDPRRYRYRGPRSLLSLIWFVAPKPHLVILLDAPAEVIRARKQEIDIDEIQRQREAYRSLVLPLPYGRVVDASRPVEEVAGEVDRIILSFLAKRTAQRFGFQSHL